MSDMSDIEKIKKIIENKLMATEKQVDDINKQLAVLRRECKAPNILLRVYNEKQSKIHHLEGVVKDVKSRIGPYKSVISIINNILEEKYDK